VTKRNDTEIGKPTGRLAALALTAGLTWSLDGGVQVREVRLADKGEARCVITRRHHGTLHCDR